jgi:hypothetical protein
MLRRVALLRTNVSADLRVSIIRVTRIGELGKRFGVTSKRIASFFAACVGFYKSHAV